MFKWVYVFANFFVFEFQQRFKSTFIICPVTEGNNVLIDRKVLFFTIFPLFHIFSDLGGKLPHYWNFSSPDSSWFQSEMGRFVKDR